VGLTDRARRRAAAAAGAVLLLLAVLLGIGPAPAAGGATVAPNPIELSGIDLHDGQIIKSGSTYYLYGTEYGCGFNWQSASPWCGFGVSTSASMSGPWSTPTLLFSPNDPDPYNPGHTYQAVCGQSGAGCFNPRMIQRTGWGANDGVWVLWWNGPAYMNSGYGSAPHAYMVMGCNGPAGPCGATAGAPYGSTYRPPLTQCAGANGDFALTFDATSAVIVCTTTGPTMALAEERLTKWGSGGTGVGATNLAGLSHVESPGFYQDPASGVWVGTYSDPNCGYCAGAPTGYMTAASLLGPWTAPGNVGWGDVQRGRRDLSATSCGGQPRTVSVVDGQPWQGIDLWRGTTNETSAGLLYVPLVYNPAVGTGATGDGHVWHAPFYDWSCN